jgi:hypothetical protein
VYTYGYTYGRAKRSRLLDGLTEELLSIAAAEERIFVTFHVKNFPGIARRWAEAGRLHTGCVIVVGIDHGEFGAILETIAHKLATRPDAADWTNLTLFLARTLGDWAVTAAGACGAALRQRPRAVPFGPGPKQHTER